MNFLNEFEERGFLHQCTDLEALKKISEKNKITFYLGFDCTAPSLHVGNLLMIMVARLLQRHGHKPIILVGGGTTKIGDPSGKDKVRQLLTEADIEDNIKGIKRSLSKFISFGDKSNDALLVNNDDWLAELKYIDVLRDIGRHFSVNRMLTMDSVKLRLDREQNLSFLEFNYMILQSYDFYYLNNKYNCSLQIGGSDQWGNIISGVELVRRMSAKETFGLTSPLITTSSGAKMGKSEKGAVWLNEDMLTPFEYFQFFRNVEDQDVIRFAKIFTDLSLDEIENLTRISIKDINQAKKIFALEATKLCHGDDEANKALKSAESLFGGGGDDLSSLPKFEMDLMQFKEGLHAYELFTIAELSPSKTEARKLIRSGGAKCNDVIIEDENMLINDKFIQKGGYIKLSAGKKRHMLVMVV